MSIIDSQEPVCREEHEIDVLTKRIAELERGECEDAGTRFDAWVCSECKATLLLMFSDYDEPSYSVDGVAGVPRYCPNCGRKAVYDD